MDIGRRRAVLVEKVKRKIYDIHPSNERFMVPMTELFRKNMFYVEMEKADGTIVDPYRICGFRVESHGSSKILRVKTTLEITNWIGDYEKVVVARVFLHDSNGNEVKNMDFDVLFSGYSLECEYQSEEAVKPVFSYAIIGE